METASHIWSDGELVPWDEATVHFLSHVIQYGSGVFEGIRAYNTPEGTAVFRLHDHMLRLEASARAYGIPMKWTVEQLEEACLHLLRETGLESAYIRPNIFYGAGSIGINPAKNEVVAMMAAFPWGAYLGDDAAEKGISAMVSSWRRISHTSLIPTAKGSGGYLNSVLAKQEALAAGYDEAIMLNDAGSISEGSGMNLFIVSRGVVYTPPVSAGILEGITRNSVMELLGDEGVEVREMDLARGALYAGDEMFLTGTAAEVTPIRSVDGRVVGDGTRGPITKKAQELFAAAVAGKLDDYRHWLEFV
ncbi:MAG TPA: branched-chain amino acid transaminase [Acidimicrobiia bacterium]|jgi:branched-chain amino acid aminotransferase|nr:branched-chain amino acid transaminase [Acidimicrobiia bacterium]